MPNYYADACHETLLDYACKARAGNGHDVAVYDYVKSVLQAPVAFTHAAFAVYLTHEIPENPYQDGMIDVIHGFILLDLQIQNFTRSDLNKAAQQVPGFAGTPSFRDVPYQILRKRRNYDQTGWVVYSEHLDDCMIKVCWHFAHLARIINQPDVVYATSEILRWNHSKRYPCLNKIREMLATNPQPVVTE